MLQLFSQKWRENYLVKPLYFWGWVLLLTTLGLFGFWVPIIYNSVNEKAINFWNIVINGSLSSFSIVILVESLLTGLSLPKSEKANYFLLVMTTLLIAIHCLIYGFILAAT